jgi:ABC-type transport system substrate-binding protein
VKVGRSFRLVKNPNFSPSLRDTAVDAGKLVTINVEVERDASAAATKVSRDLADFMSDTPPVDRLPEIRASSGDRYHEFPAGSTSFFFMSPSMAPFDDPRVRRAVNHAIDPAALRRIRGGLLSATNTVLPPSVAGHRVVSDPYPLDVEKARALIREAGAEGDAVTVWGPTGDVAERTVEYYAGVLDRIGLQAETRLLPVGDYLVRLADGSLPAQTGWAERTHRGGHPAGFIDDQVDPGDDGLTERIRAASAAPEMTREVEAEWAALDREVQAKAYWGVYGHPMRSTFMSGRLDPRGCSGEHAVWVHDWSQFCLK